MTDKQKLIVESLMDAMQSNGLAPWQKPWKSGLDCMNAISRKPYSGMNTLFTAMHNVKNSFGSPYFLTYKQAVDLGGHVIKGSKGCTVFFYKTIVKKSEVEDDKKESFWYATSYTVFNIEQTSLADDPRFAIPEETILDPSIRSKDADRTIKEYSSDLHEYKEISGLNRAFYVPEKDVVNVPGFNDFHSVAAYYSTVFHELSHSTGHGSRLNRKLETSKHSENYAIEELIAEISSTLCCSKYGYDRTKDNSAAYIKSWWSRLKQDPGMFWTAVQKAEKAHKLICK